MKAYKIFKHPAGQYEAVKDGWSWPGFFFGMFWALFKKLWLVALVLFAAALVLGSVVMSPEASLLVQIIVACVVGYNGNKWRADKLRSTGYQEVGTSFAENGPTAVAKQINES